MIYEYKCRQCGHTEDHDYLRDPWPCPMLIIQGHWNNTRRCHGTMKRVYSFNIQPSMQEHYNPSVGTVVSSKRQHSDLLKRQSEAATIRTGIPHNYVPVDPADSRAVFGVTDEGLDATRAREVEDGKRDVQRYFPTSLPNSASSG